MNRRRAVVATLVVAGAALTFVDRPRGASRSLTVAATSDALSQLREWDRRIDQMARSGELRLRESRDDGLVPGRRHERFDQFHRGVPVWGGDVARQTDHGLTVSQAARDLYGAGSAVERAVIEAWTAVGVN